MNEIYISGKESKKMPSKTMAWLAPAGTFTQQAAEQALKLPSYEGYVLLEAKKIGNIFEMIVNGTATCGVVPIENSTAGPVKDTHYALGLYGEKIQIIDEVVLPISHSLYMNLDASPSEIKTVASKDQALAQCEQNIARYLPHAERLETDSTAQAVSLATKDPSIAAIGSRIAGERLGLIDQLRQIDRFEDNPLNATTFVVVAKKDQETRPLTGKDKTTCIIEIRDKAGSLYRMLTTFMGNGVNLTKIKSLGKINGSVRFLVSIDGHQQEMHVTNAFVHLRTQEIIVKNLGSYRRAEYNSITSSNTPNMEYAIKMIKREEQNGEKYDRNTAIVVFTLKDEIGALVNALEPFAQRSINLTKIDSLPSGKFEEYIFYLAFNKTDKNSNIDKLLEQLSLRCKTVVLL